MPRDERYPRSISTGTTVVNLPLKCLASDIVEATLKRGRQPNGSRHGVNVQELNLEAG